MIKIINKIGSQRLPSLRNWKSQYIVKEGKVLNFGSHKENLGVNDSQTSTNGSPECDIKKYQPDLLIVLINERVYK